MIVIFRLQELDHMSYTQQVFALSLHLSVGNIHIKHKENSCMIKCVLRSPAFEISLHYSVTHEFSFFMSFPNCFKFFVASFCLMINVEDLAPILCCKNNLARKVEPSLPPSLVHSSSYSFRCLVHFLVHRLR